MAKKIGDKSYIPVKFWQMIVLDFGSFLVIKHVDVSK